MKALGEHTDKAKAAGDPRCRDQIMADTLVERLTGQAQATDVSAELHFGGPLARGDPHRRNFDGYLLKLITWRDRQCRDPYCEAPIRHIDHVRRYTDSGLTIYPNGRGECERGNYVREMAGWKVEITSSGLDGPPHAVKITTPTGHSYLSRAP